jgi:hypothetical protein
VPKEGRGSDADPVGVFEVRPVDVNVYCEVVIALKELSAV